MVLGFYMVLIWFYALIIRNMETVLFEVFTCLCVCVFVFPF